MHNLFGKLKKRNMLKVNAILYLEQYVISDIMPGASCDI